MHTPFHPQLNRRQLMFGLTVLAANLGKPDRALAATSVRWWKAYWNTSGGQVHVHNAAPEGSVRQRTPLVCFHPSSYSGAFFAEYQALMAEDRWVLCPDTPGFGESYQPTTIPTIQTYALAMADVLDGLGFGAGAAGPVDVLGFHTGCFIAAELAVQRPDLVRRLVLPGIPFHVGEEREAQYQKTAKPKQLYKDPQELGRMWAGRWQQQGEAVGLPRLLQLLGDELGSGPNSWWAYDAVFSYRCDQQFPKIAAPTLAVATGGDLFAPTQAAARFIPNATLESYPDRGAPLFNEHYELMADVSRRYLDELTDHVSGDSQD